MIPAIRRLIDEANNAIGNGDEGSDGLRISIPTSDIAELSELRKREYVRRAREEHSIRILEIEEAEARANQRDTVEMERQYGLPLGEACEDVWESIFRHVVDVEDISNLRNTCVLFREMLERKYRTLRFIQVGSKLAHKFGGLGGFQFLLVLREVCKSGKATVDHLLSVEKLGKDTITSEHHQRRPSFRFRAEQQSLDGLEWLVEDLQPLKVFLVQLPIKSVTLVELSDDEENQFFHDPAFVLPNNPLAPSLRTEFQKLLGLTGSSLRCFHYASMMDFRGAYDQLRSWITLMPNLEEIVVSVYGEPRNPNPENPPAPVPDLDPFPSCPKLKTYISSRTGFSISYVRQIFLANPWISEVFLYYWAIEWRDEAFADFVFLKLETLKLIGANAIPPREFLQFRFQWPLKSLSLLLNGENEEAPARDVFNFINSFKVTLEELEVNWKLRDSGEYLDLPKVSRLSWKLWPNFMAFDFMIPLENLQHLDVNVVACQEVNTSLENVKGFIGGNNLPSIFPGLKRIRAMIIAAPEGSWVEVWKA